MRKKLNISKDLSLPLETVTNTTAILARRRVGKTYTASVIAEEMIVAGLPWVALDPTGAWWGLGSSANGKSAGLPVIVLGGPHGHIKLEPTSGKVIANLVVDHPGWYIIDFSRFESSIDERTFSAEFGRQLYRRQQHKPSALHLFIDEADMFVPQKMPKNGDEMFRAYDAIIRRGGIYGLGVTLISQRPAIVNKDVLTQCETLIILATSAPQDQDPIFDWVGRNGTIEQLKKIKETLSSLKTGQAWYFSPNLDIFKLITIRERTTFNSSATPKPGIKSIEPKVFAQIDLQSLGEEIQATIERTKSEDPVFLRREIENLRHQLAIRPKETETKIETKIKIKEVPIFKPGELEALQNSIGPMNKAIDAITQAIAQATLIKNLPIDPNPTSAPKISPVTKNTRELPLKNPYSINPSTAGDIVIDGPKQRILDALAWLRTIQQDKPLKVAVAFLAGYTADGGAFGNPCGKLRAMNLIEYHPGKRMSITPDGIEKANSPTIPLTSEEMINHVFNRLPGPEKKILLALLQHGRTPMRKEELAQASNYAEGGGAFGNPLGRLRSLGVIEYLGSGLISPCNFLFMDDR